MTVVTIGRQQSLMAGLAQQYVVQMLVAAVSIGWVLAQCYTNQC